MIMNAIIGEKTPNFGVSEWVQGAPTNFDQEKDHIVLLEVFQINCPGCFMHAIPEAVDIYNNYKDSKLDNLLIKFYNCIILSEIIFGF